jgi:hypothetical protein
MPSVQNATPGQRRALATFLETDQYLAGALTLAYTLRKHGNALPMIMYTPEGMGELSPVSRDLAECAGWQVREVEGIIPDRDASEQFRHEYFLRMHVIVWT